MSTSRSTRAALDYAAHRLTCFDCTSQAMCDVARDLLDSRIKAVAEPYARKQEAVQMATVILGEMDEGYARELINQLTAPYTGEVDR